MIGGVDVKAGFRKKDWVGWGVGGGFCRWIS